MNLTLADVREICALHAIQARAVKTVSGSFAKNIYLIDGAYLLRVSESSMAGEQEKFRRVAALDFTPKVLHAGVLERPGGTVHYTLLTLLPGEDFAAAYPGTSAAEQERLGAAAARFLDALHATAGPAYDIGLYIPILPRFTGSWREGHAAYWAMLEQQAQALALGPESRAVFDRAFRYVRAESAALDVQAGPRLLHNDFHPRNLLVRDGAFAGVIDWECSQFGEADFDLTHLIHWCAYPPAPGIDFRPFLRGLFRDPPRCARVPRLARRLAIYQVEHEIQQILWSGGASEPLRVPRLARWLGGGVEELLREVAG